MKLGLRPGAQAHVPGLKTVKQGARGIVTELSASLSCSLQLFFQKLTDWPVLFKRRYLA